MTDHSIRQAIANVIPEHIFMDLSFEECSPAEQKAFLRCADAILALTTASDADERAKELATLRSEAATPSTREAMELARNIIHGPLHAATRERNYAKAAEYQSYIDTIDAALCGDAAQPIAKELATLRDFAGWVDTWISNPVGSYSVNALDGLFRMTREKLFALAPDWKQDQAKTPCPGCDGHECDNGCQYPGASPSPQPVTKASHDVGTQEERT